MQPKTIGATRFKERCLALLDRLSPDGLVITKHGRPVARVLPYQQGYSRLIGSLRDRITVRGDIMTTGVRWDADDQP
ncbi:MAG: type II toxin-antitoxin system prevent-host-death family antitoxin [Gemmatimonadetes bacterium]|nr:type II toxin-antitoxin system prevent-host-death family antitoxin [Gemmatimonadota bacterium]